MALIWPNGASNTPRVTSEFNPMRKHPVSGAMRPHRGIDLAGWNDIVSPVAGKVTTRAYQAGGAGNYVNITADNGDVFKFFHLAAPSPLKVGQRVKPGDPIGVMGATGSATGVHLHFEIWSGGKPINPRDYYTQHPTGLGAEYQEEDMEKVLEWIASVHDSVLGVKADVATVHQTVIDQGKEIAALKAEIAKIRPDINTVHQAILKSEAKK